MKCNSLRLVLLAVGLVTLSAWVEPILGAPTVFFRRDNSTTFMTSFPNSQDAFNRFTYSLTSFGVEDVETAVGVNPGLTFGGSGITASSNGVIAQSAPGFQIGNQALLELDAAGFPQVNTIFTFNQYINAFGTFVIQGGDAGNNNPITLRLRDTATSLFEDVTLQVGPGWGFDNAFFVGVHGTVPFDEVEYIESGDFGDGMLYDNIVAGFVPEPCSLVLMVIGGACALCRNGRFRRGSRSRKQ
jgi:hypothetical protein